MGQRPLGAARWAGRPGYHPASPHSGMTGVIREPGPLWDDGRVDRRDGAGAARRVNGVRRYGVDEEICIGCGLCHERAPENFEVPEGEHASRVSKQPVDTAEDEACFEAEEYCPAGGISHDPDAPPS